MDSMLGLDETECSQLKCLGQTRTGSSKVLSVADLMSEVTS